MWGRRLMIRCIHVGAGRVEGVKKVFRKLDARKSFGLLLELELMVRKFEVGQLSSLDRGKTRIL